MLFIIGLLWDLVTGPDTGPFDVRREDGEWVIYYGCGSHPHESGFASEASAIRRAKQLKRERENASPPYTRF